MASQRLKASIDKENNSPFNEGFLDVPFINAANTNPAPIAPPPNPIVAKPAPINFPAANMIFLKKFIKTIFLLNFY